MRMLLFVLAIAFSSGAHAGQWVNWFKVNELFLSSAANMHFRVYGMGNMGICPAGPDWAYIDEADSGSKGLISSLLTAYASGKDVSLFIDPKNYSGNGDIYCHILEVRVKG